MKSYDKTLGSYCNLCDQKQTMNFSAALNHILSKPEPTESASETGSGVSLCRSADTEAGDVVVGIYRSLFSHLLI